MKRLIFLSVAAAIASVLVQTCYYDSEEDLYPFLSSQCDTVSVTFTDNISTLLENNCLGCHSNSAPPTSGNGIRLQDYADVMARATNISGAIKHEAPYTPMPKNGGRLNACLITQFDIWLSRGMPN